MKIARLLKPAHVGFADESHYNIGRYRGLGLVSLEVKNLRRLEVDLKSHLDQSNVNELKWKNIDGAKERLAAKKMLSSAVSHAKGGTLRTDILIWDIEDPRHKIRGRDDLANLERMYNKLFKNVMIERWPDKSTWQLYPDENTAMDWTSLEDFLDNVSSRLEIGRDLFTRGICRSACDTALIAMCPEPRPTREFTELPHRPIESAFSQASPAIAGARLLIGKALLHS